MADYNFPLDNLPLFGEFIVVDNPPEVQVIEQRPNCPFYGFRFERGVVLDTGGNECVWEGKGCSCTMEKYLLEPNWDECSWSKNKKALKKIGKYASNTQIFPNEFGPRNGEEYQGVMVSEWIEYIKALHEFAVRH